MALDNFRTIELIWDKANKSIIKTIKTASSDTTGRYLSVKILDGGQEVTLDNATLQLYWEHPNFNTSGTDDFETMNNGGLFKMTFSKEMLTNIGELTAHLVLTLPDGKITSDGFTIEVIKGADGGVVVPTNGNGLVEQIDGKIDKGNVTLGDLTQEVKLAMTGGSVAVVGENAVGTENIKNDAVTADKTTFLVYNNIYTPSKIIEGKFLQSNGVLIDHPLYDVTDFEDVLPNEDYETNSHRLSVFYNGSKSPIGFLDSSANITNTNTILSTPDKTRFMRTNILKTERANYKLYPVDKKFILSNEVAFKVGSSELDIVQDKNILVKENVSVGKFINNDGTLTSIPSYYTTDFMPFKEGDYDFNVHRRSVFYDEQKNIIGYIDSGSILRGKIPIPAPVNTAFIRTSVPDTDWDTFSIYARSFSVLEFTDEIQLPTSTPTISPEIKSEWDGKNAINFGTSISWQDGKAYTQSSEIGKIARGYQTHLREKLGMNINNQGVSGSRIVGSDGTRILAETFDFKPYDLAIFEIGTNDFKLNTPLGVLGQMGDTNFETGTFIGAYRHLIEYVLTSNPNIKIVLFTPLQRDNGGYDVNTVNEAGHRLIDYVNAIRELEEMYSLRLVDMYKNSGFNKFTLSTYTMDGLHPNDIGYEEMGGLAVKEIDQINS